MNILLFTMFLLIPNGASIDSTQSSQVWRGSFGWEHDTTQYSIQIKFSKDTLMYISEMKLSLHASLIKSDSVSSRFYISPIANDSLFSNGTFDLIKVSTFPSDVIQIQFYPKMKEQLWIGQLKLIK